MINFFTSIALAVCYVLVAFGVLALYKSLDVKKEYRFKQHRHITFLSIDVGIGTVIYFAAWAASLAYDKVDRFINGYYIYHLIPVLVLVVYFFYKVIYRLCFIGYGKTSTDILERKIPAQYYEKNGKFYLSPYYSTLANVFKYAAIIVTGLIAVGLGVAYYVSVKHYIFSQMTVVPFIIIPLMFMELYSYFDGVIEKKAKKQEEVQENIEQKETVWVDLDTEYHRLWQKQMLGRYCVANQYERKIIKKTGKRDKVSENIAKSASGNEADDFIYSRVLSPIMRGDDMIIESCFLQSFSDIIVPIVNIMFTASKRIMFLCDNYSTVKQCEKWFEELDIKSNTSNSNVVIDVLNYENTESIKMDSNVDIYIGTVDLALNSKAVFENIDVVFCLNIDKIISESALNLNLLASVLSGDRYDNVQYILFGNRVNGLKQTASQVFMRNDFVYQVVNSSAGKSISANFWSTEKGWLQSSILPGFAAQFLGQLIPLAIPAFKYDVQHVDIIASGESFTDQMLSLQTAQPLLKKYMGKDIMNIDEAISFAENENFMSLNDNSVVVVGDSSNNAALVLLNWMKYAKTNMFLNVVSSPYLIRDYIVSNIDFFVGNVETIGNILPIPKSNIKLSVYRLINQLCYGNVAEEILLREINNQETDIKIDTFENDQVRFVTEALQDLTKRAFGTDIFFASYLTSQRVSKEKSMDSKRYYKLLDSVKNELPERLFKNITFIDSEQFAKVLKKIPVFELYQNYLEGQYVTFDGKYYLIDKIDYDNGIVELTYSSNNASVRYRQCRQINNVVHLGVSKELPVLKVRDSVLKKSVVRADIDVNTDGYYEFSDAVSFAHGDFGYKKVDTAKKGLSRNYKSTNILAVNISSPSISVMSEKEKFRLSFTLSVLLNEMFETLFSSINQYILVRNVVSNDKVWKDFKEEELLKLYRPIVDASAENGINIYITEDTELEKGITDTIVNNFDNIILRLLFDYLYWLVKEEKDKEAEKWFVTDSGDYINIEKMDKFAFLKYGADEINPCFDFEAALNCLSELILKGNDTLTHSRLEFIKKRKQNGGQEIKDSQANEESISPSQQNDSDDNQEQQVVQETEENSVTPPTEENVQKESVEEPAIKTDSSEKMPIEENVASYEGPVKPIQDEKVEQPLRTSLSVEDIDNALDSMALNGQI